MPYLEEDANSLMGKRLVLLFDGTRNDKDSDTNIARLKDAIAPYGADGLEQRTQYWDGVGVKRFERLRGGVFGRYVSDKIQDGYDWIRQDYDEGDDVFVFGFSRGAFVALALVGFCAWCGLLRRDAEDSIGNLFRRYLNGTRRAQERGYEGALSRDELLARREEQHNLSPDSLWLLENTERLPIKFVGLFDTVRATGLESLVPRYWRKRREHLFGLRGTLACRYTLHLPDTVERAYQALALDEHRAPFAERVWTISKGKRGSTQGPTVPKYAEQRWFAGAHANIGGGYRNDPLRFLPLRWMQQRASKAGLSFQSVVTPRIEPQTISQDVKDSFSEFFKPPLRWVLKRYDRTVDAFKVGGEGDHPIPKEHERLYETVDESVLEGIVTCAEYRPRHLAHALDGICSDDTYSVHPLVHQARDRLEADSP